MDFDQWRIGNTYAPAELTRTIRDALTEYQISFAYNSKKAPKIQKANVNSEICSLEELVKKKFTSLEIEFRGHSAPEEQRMVYLWLKFSLAEGYYKLNASIKSRSNQNYLREKPQVWGLGSVETELGEADSTDVDLVETDPIETGPTETDLLE
ncbi:MAG TPA: hypothetical protein VJA23_01325 [Candidatus Nanoarchaeia archaeon]|nr:hypothetical protein [Candidatus Nanoarchaeia archaeon]